jgi:hypothetical protein
MKSTDRQATNFVGNYERLLTEINRLSPDNISVVTPRIYLGDNSDKSKKLSSATNLPNFEGKKPYWKYQHHCLYGALLQHQQVAGKLNLVSVHRADDPIKDFTRELSIIKQNGFSDLESGYAEKK